MKVTSHSSGNDSVGTRGFTLVELLVVIGIIAVLVAILLPSLNKARQQAVTVSCAARMRQLETAVLMYVNDNHGYLTPLAYSQNNAITMNRPSIFPCGGESYLSRYLGKELRNPVSGFMSNSIPSAKLYVCPEMEPMVDQVQQWSYYSYKYNAILGGQDPTQWGAPYNGNSAHIYTPWRLARVRQSSNVLLFTEGNSVQGSLDTRFMGVILDGAQMRPANKNGHTPRYGYWLHSQKDTGAYYSYWNNSWNNMGRQGTINIGYCDGSVRSVRWNNNAYPSPAFTPDTFIDPYHVGETAW